MAHALDQSQVQGNVLTSYGKAYGHAAYVGLQIAIRPLAVGVLRRWLDAVSFGKRPAGAASDPLINLAFTWEGLRRLGVDPDVLQTFPKDFRDGAEQRAVNLGDVWPDKHEFRSCHVLLVVHAKDAFDRDTRTEELLAGRGLGLRLVRRLDVGFSDDDRREHFGFRDGSSQPAVEGVDADPVGDGVYAGVHPRSGTLRRQLSRVAEDVGLKPVARHWRTVRAGEFLLGHENEDGRLPDGPPEPLGPDGTFMVYREIDQDKAAWDEYIERWSTDIGMAPDALKAKIIGRRVDGAPLAQRVPDDPGLTFNRRRANDFRYDEDRDGFGCPLGAHVRRANPRDALPGGAERTMRHRIIRRGMPYEQHGRTGLAFVCYGASITQGFEFIQNTWLRTGHAFGLAGDPDFLLQQPGAEGKMTGRMVLQGHRPIVLPPPSKQFTEVRGCEYLFLPSRRACGWLAALPRTR